MNFDVAADAYDAFMGRYSRLLSPQMVDFAEVGEGDRVLDVGSGPGILTGELVARLGPEAVTAIDPSASFVEAARDRHPGVTVLQGSAEELPFPDGAFDASLAQLVVHFMSDPVRGLAEMRRVTRDGGAVAASVWDLAGGRAPLSLFWRAAHDLDMDAADESRMSGAREGHLVELFEAAGLHDVRGTRLHREPRAPELRGMVGSVHAGRRACRRRTSPPWTKSVAPPSANDAVRSSPTVRSR